MKKARTRTPVTNTTFIEALRDEHGLTYKEADSTLKTVLQTMRKGLSEGRKIRLNTIGTLEPVDVKGRNGINPQTFEPIYIEPSKSVRFTLSQPLKDEINGKNEEND